MGKKYIPFLQLIVREKLFKNGFINEIKTSWGNKAVPQTFHYFP